MSNEQNFDAIILGIGHQSLISANYLARSGFKTCIIDTPPGLIGSTPYTPFHDSAVTGPCAHMPVSISASVVEELDLASYGFSMSDENPAIFAPQKEKGYFYSSTDATKLMHSLSQYSEKDSEKFQRLHADIHTLASILSDINEDLPDYTDNGWKDIWAIFESARHLALGSKDLQVLFAKLMSESLTDFLNNQFESSAIKGLLAHQATFGSMVNPDKEGSAAHLVAFILNLGNKPLAETDWHPLRGSMHHYFKALTNAALAYGVNFATAATAQSIKIEENQFKGIQTDDGFYSAPLLIADINPQTLFLDLIDEALIPADLKLRIQSFSGVSGFMRVKCTLKELPKFTCLEGKKAEDFLKGEICIAPDLEYIQTAFQQTKAEGGSQRPGISMVIPSLQSEELNNDGHHTCSIIGQYFEPNLPDTEENRIAVAKALIASINDFAPNFRDSIANFLPIMGTALDRTIGPLNIDLTGGGKPLTKLFARRFAHHALMADAPFANIYICGYGPESSANPHVIDAGERLASYIINTQTPKAA